MSDSQHEGWELMAVPAIPGTALHGQHEARDLTRKVKALLRHHYPERTRTFEQILQECGGHLDDRGGQFAIDIAQALTELVAQGKVVQTDMPDRSSSNTVKNYKAAPGTYSHHDRQVECNPKDLSKSISSWLKYKHRDVHCVPLDEAHTYACTRGFHVTKVELKKILLDDRKHWIVNTNEHGIDMVQVTRLRGPNGLRVYLPAQI